MSLMLVKVPPALAARIRAEPALLAQVWDESAGLVTAEDKLFEDYLGLSRTVDEQPDRFPVMFRAMNGTGDELDYDFGYGPAFVIEPAEAARISAGLAEEGWWRSGDEVITIDHAIAEFYTLAADQGRTIVGGVS
jgi:hypothetical protein